MPHYSMKFNLHTSFFILLLSAFTITSKAQLTTSSAMTPAQMVQNVLLGTGISATNITYNGAPLAIGTFNGTASNLGLATGVILCTGHVSNAIGPNNNPGITNVNGFPGDPDLNIICAPAASHDACILEFDFIPRSDTVKFRYIFGSEEYMEYVNSPPLPATVNDGFGFFISGPGIAGPFSNNAKNIALIPGTALPVTMYNISLNNHSQYYFDNGNGSGTGTAPNGLTIQYDGFTVPLTAVSAVQCGQTYHIKIAIADAFDSSNDSGVFLEAGSFSSSRDIVLSANTWLNGLPATNDTVLYEGCGKARIHFQRLGTACNLLYPDTVYYSISGTAINGVNYTTIGDSVMFASSIDTASILLSAIPNSAIGGSQTITLNIINSTPPASITLTIIDSSPLSVNLNPDTTFNCPPQSLHLTAIGTGGTSPLGYTYTWINANSNSSTATVSPTQTTTYYVTITDACGNTATDSMHVVINAYTPMIMTSSHDTTICYGNAVSLWAHVSGGRPIYTYSWNPGGATTDSIVVSPGTTTTYTVSATDQCAQTLTHLVTVTTHLIQALFSFDFTSNQNVQFNNYSLGAVSSYWNFGDGSADSTSTNTSPTHYFNQDGTYLVKLIVKNIEGCSDSILQTLVILPDFYFYFPNTFTPNGDGKNDIFTGFGVGVKTFQMSIYNRWGELIYYTNDMQKGWDGTYMGKEAEVGVYVCIFDLESFNNKTTRKIGNVNLIR